MNKRVYYLSGPMSGYEEYNYPMFTRVAKHLRDIGLQIYSPHECEPEPDQDSLNPTELWQRMMVKCMKMMQECNAIILLQGWPESRGARMELSYATQHDFDVYYYDEVTDVMTRMSRVK